MISKKRSSLHALFKSYAGTISDVTCITLLTVISSATIIAIYYVATLQWSTLSELWSISSAFLKLCYVVATPALAWFVWFALYSIIKGVANIVNDQETKAKILSRLPITKEDADVFGVTTRAEYAYLLYKFTRYTKANGSEGSIAYENIPKEDASAMEETFNSYEKDGADLLFNSLSYAVSMAKYFGPVRMESQSFRTIDNFCERDDYERLPKKMQKAMKYEPQKVESSIK